MDEKNATGTIDIENKSRLVVADEAMTMLRDAFLTAKREHNTQFPTIVATPRTPHRSDPLHDRHLPAVDRQPAAAPAPYGRALPHGWERGPADAWHGFDGRFAPGTNQHVTACVTRRDLRSPSGIAMRQRRLTDVGKAVGKILRHHRTLQVNSLEFAWMTDVSQGVWDDEGWRYNGRG